ncbi:MULTISPECIES: hypothetical protein [unclassified Acinetobacter]|uniref:hypothetical protein n=1 Tax=unclassified Acinetobacter TaxID=196816 RepID=UPI001C23CAFE|nr:MULTISPECIES: hypothetical protein [unclassified Acinetobacter]
MDKIKQNLISHIKNTFDDIQNETKSFQQILRQIVRDEEQKNDSSKKLFNIINSNRLPIDFNYLILNLDLITKNINSLSIEFNKNNFEYMSESILNMLDSKINILIYDANLIKKESGNLKDLIEFRKNIGDKVVNPSEDQVKRNLNLKENSLKNITSNYHDIINKIKSFIYDI